MVTLISNAEHKALTTLERAKIFLDISGDSKDGLLTLLINQVTQFIESYVGNLLSQTYTQELLDGGRTLALANVPVTSFTTLQRNDSGDASENWQTIDEDEYFVDEESGLITMANGCDFLPGTQRYRATYVAGYKIDYANENDLTKHTLPAHIELACHMLLSGRMNTRKSQGLESAKVGDVSMTFRAIANANQEVTDILDSYGV